ncbi:MAG: isoprenylcysteine carboxylmethyltransferase family protein [Terricaulis sp.]
MAETFDLAPRPAIGRRFGTAALEIAERGLIAILYYGLVTRLWANFTLTHNAADVLTFASESLVVVLAMIRRPAKDVSLRPQDWLLAFGASFLPLFLAPAPIAAFGPAFIGIALQSVSFVAQLAAKIFLFRNFGIMPALRGVAVRGPYAIVRHPMYAAYFVGQLGFLYAFPTIWNAALLAVWAIAQVLRIFAEERVLARSPDYRAYLSRVRWRLIPGVF